MLNRLITGIFLTAGCVSIAEAQPADSLRTDTLREVTVVTVAPVKVITQSEDGRAILSRSGLAELPTFMGSSDPVWALRTLPAIATNNDLQANMPVKGSASGANAYYADGLRISNPLHMLGFYSAFNPAFFESYEFRSGHIPACLPNTSGAYLEASTAAECARSFSGTASVGLIESHFALTAPLRGINTSVSVGARVAYPSAVFPGLLTIGVSKVKYGFADANLAVLTRFSNRDLLKISVFADKDKTDVTNGRQGPKTGYFGWTNLAAGATWFRSLSIVRAFWSHYGSSLSLQQGGRKFDLPSGLDQATVATEWTVRNNLRAGGDLSWRRTLGQRNASLPTANGVAPRTAFEANAGLDWQRDFGSRVSVDAGLRMSFYATASYSVVMPQPRLSLTYRIADDYFVSAAYRRMVRFDRLVETSAGGFPSDFWTSASADVRPEDTHAFELSAGGRVPWLMGTFRVDLYVKQLTHAADYAGSIMDMLSPSYDGLSNIVDAKGLAKGLSVSMMRQFGRLRGRLGYNLGRTTLQADRFGNDAYPASYDRTHDFNVSVVWQPFDCLQLSAAYVYATGLPFTRAKYGYMIGENLICEYFPRNSSRLPDYNRLDLSATWKHAGRNNLVHQVTVGVYNATGCRNVLFQYLDYSVADGISHKESVMNMAIPSITYTITYK